MMNTKQPSNKNRSAVIERTLRPNRPVWIIGAHGVAVGAPELLKAETIGWKAYGLASLPQKWVPAFFVIGAEVMREEDNTLQEWITDAVAKALITIGPVIVRSSGTVETLRSRGSFASEKCSLDQLVATIRALSSSIPAPSFKEVNWIIQNYVTSKNSGHLSNERHLRREHRDWVVETELQNNRPGYTSPIAVRNWRQGTNPYDLELRCGSEPQISLCLRKVAHWTTAFHSRFHLEWVWDGAAIWIVQIDHAFEEAGIAPVSLRPKSIAEISTIELSFFKAANAQQVETLRKLHNAKLYSELGYHMPEFYILDDQKILKGILHGEIPSELESDLRRLTQRPLILRTDGYNIPDDKWEMLPRSDELRSAKAAREWLLSTFKKNIEEGGHLSSSLCLIGHHFLPSVASAWAGAEPGLRMVRIESLWGLPEGLYWYSHDTYEVDIQNGADERSSMKKNRIFRRLRYKGTFIASDSEGHWIPMHTSVPYDWLPSINHDSWIVEVASTTRKIADREGYPITVMWLIDNDKRLTKHAVLPWFHNRWKLEGRLKAAPRKKLASAQDYIIADSTSWEELKKQVLRGVHVERIVVRPTDPDLIRNRHFADDIGSFSRSHKIVVELAGGILSHAYYALQRAGAQVECIDLIGADEDVIEFNKLVRDKIPALIEGRNEKVEIVQLSGDALITALKQKLVEEAFEVTDAKAGKEIIAELADVQEVISALARAIQSTPSQVIIEREEKRKRRGGFDRGFMLRKTAMPHSLSTANASADAHKGLSQSSFEQRGKIIDSSAIPSSLPYRRPDLRNVDQQPEKVFTFESEINRIGNTKISTTFELPIDTENERSFTLSIEFTRIGATLRGYVRLRLQPQQMSFDISKS